jgi:hypothetical protein
LADTATNLVNAAIIDPETGAPTLKFNILRDIRQVYLPLMMET